MKKLKTKRLFPFLVMMSMILSIALTTPKEVIAADEAATNTAYAGESTEPLIASDAIDNANATNTTGATDGTADVDTTATIQHVYDNAGLLSTSEISELEALCTTYGDEAKIEIMILTHDDSDAPYAEDYVENFEDQMPVADRVYLLIDMNNRDVFMEGFGLAETYIHSKRISVITDEITPYLSNGDYYDAFVIYIKQSASYMSDDSDLNYNHDYSYGTPQSSDPNAANYDETWPSDYNSGNKATSILSNLWLQLLIAMAIGAISVAIIAYNSGGRMTANGNNYIDPNHSGLIGRRDDYIRTTVTRIRKPQNNNTGNGGGGFNAGGFRGGMSGGGRSHSSGGGKF